MAWAGLAQEMPFSSYFLCKATSWRSCQMVVLAACAAQLGCFL